MIDERSQRAKGAADRAAPTTDDALFGGSVALRQPGRGGGYRVNVDAILLATFACTTTGTRRVARAAFDLGAGVGAVGLSLVHLGAARHVTMVERDPKLAELARVNAESNQWSDRIGVLEADVLDAAKSRAGAADLVVCNPPYVMPGRGRPASPARSGARSGPITTFLDAARRLAGRRARVCFVYPANEATTLLAELRARGLEPKRLRAVHGRDTVPARIVLVECVAGRPGGLVVEPPIIETSVYHRPR